MLRKTSLVGILSLFLASPSFAGFYVGGAVGPEGATFSQRAHVIRPGTFDVIDKEHFSGTGVFGSIFAGYGFNFWGSFYMAGEINGNASSVEYDLVNEEFLHQNFSKTYFTVRYSEGVSFLPGYFLSENTLVYGRVGYINGRLKIVESDPTIPSFNTNRSGIRYGLGIRHAFTPRLTAMMDYSQINYSNVRGTVFEPFGGVTKATKITPNTAQVAFGLIYNFDVPEPIYEK